MSRISYVHRKAIRTTFHPVEDLPDPGRFKGAKKAIDAYCKKHPSPFRFKRAKTI